MGTTKRTTTVEEITVEGIRVHGAGREGGRISGWVVYAEGRREESWGVSFAQAAQAVVRNLRYLRGE